MQRARAHWSSCRASVASRIYTRTHTYTHPHTHTHTYTHTYICAYKIGARPTQRARAHWSSRCASITSRISCPPRGTGLLPARPLRSLDWRKGNRFLCGTRGKKWKGGGMWWSRQSDDSRDVQGSFWFVCGAGCWRAARMQGIKCVCMGVYIYTSVWGSIYKLCIEQREKRCVICLWCWYWRVAQLNDIVCVYRCINIRIYLHVYMYIYMYIYIYICIYIFMYIHMYIYRYV